MLHQSWSSDDPMTADEEYADDAFDGDTDLPTETKSEDGLVAAAVQGFLDEEVRSQAGSSASSDLDAITEAEADRAADNAAAEGCADDAYENDAFDISPEQSDMLQDNSAAQESAVQSPGPQSMSAQDSPSEAPASQDSQALDSAAETAAAPMPPLHRIPSDVRPPARPSRAFIRHAISLTQPDSGNALAPGPMPAASPLPPTPQAPAGPPPRHRSVPFRSCSVCMWTNYITSIAHINRDTPFCLFS